MRGIVDAISGTPVSRNRNAARIAYDAHLARMASDIEASIHGKLAGRKQISLAGSREARIPHRQGTAGGDDAPVVQELRHAPHHASLQGDDAEATGWTRRRWRVALKPKPPSGWRLADGPEWGALNGKFIKAEAFGDLPASRAADEVRVVQADGAVLPHAQGGPRSRANGVLPENPDAHEQDDQQPRWSVAEQSPYWSLRAAKEAVNWLDGKNLHPVIQSSSSSTSLATRT